jgi:hypothetical protein
VPRPLCETRRRRLFEGLATSRIPSDIVERVNYYNKLEGPTAIPGAVRNGSFGLRGPSYYYYDLRQYLRSFGPDLHFRYFFGDINWVPDLATLVKSRPICADNANSVVMKLDKLRHFTWPRDPMAFRDKRKSLVWRGAIGPGMENRADLVRRRHADRRHDIGQVGRPFEGIAPKGYLPIPEQLRHRYILSLEGHDVATNLKWILASNSLCLMPRPRFETWFMEGRLRPGVHYAELRTDLADLDDKIAHYDRNEDEALAIVAAANAYADQFRDGAREDVLSLLVLQKYFERTGQLAPEPFSASLFDGCPAYSAASARAGS